MTFLETIKDLRTLISKQTILETVKKLCIVLYGDSPVFTNSDSSLEECEKWINEHSKGQNINSSFSFFISCVRDIYENFSKYEQIYTCLRDEESKKVLINLLAHRLTRDDYYLLNAFSGGERQYFCSSFMKYKSGGVFVDCGALNGATTLEYAQYVPNFKRAYVYEPLPNLYETCTKALSIFASSRISTRQAAVSDQNGKIRFDPYIEGSSHISEEGSLEVLSVCLDEDIHEAVDFIKMDIEGAEQSAILGSKKHIQKDRPILAISVYHQPSDLHKIPLMLIELCPNYHFYMRHHMTDTNETIFYGLPYEMDDFPRGTNSIKSTDLSTFLVDEYMRVQINQKNYFLHILKLLSDAKIAHIFFERQFNAEKEARAFFENQFNVEKEAHTFFEKQFNVEKEAHTFFKKQFNAEKEAHLFFEQQFNTEKEAHTFFEQQYNLISLDKEKFQKRVEKQERDIQDLENRLRVLQNENSKLNYKLQILKKDSFINKIIKLKKYEV